MEHDQVELNVCVYFTTDNYCDQKDTKLRCGRIFQF